MDLNLKCKVCGIKGGLHAKTWKHKLVPNTNVKQNDEVVA